MTLYTVTSSFNRANDGNNSDEGSIGVYFNDYFYIFYEKVGEDNSIRYSYSSDGETWTEGAKLVTDFGSKAALVVTKKGNYLFLFYGDTSGWWKVNRLTQNADGTLSVDATYSITSYNQNGLARPFCCTTLNRIWFASVNYDGSNYRVKILYSSDNGATWTSILNDASELGGGGYMPRIALIHYPPNGDDAIIVVGAKYAQWFKYAFVTDSWPGWTNHTGLGDYGNVAIGYWQGKLYWYESERNNDAAIYYWENNS